MFIRGGSFVLLEPDLRPEVSVLPVSTVGDRFRLGDGGGVNHLDSTGSCLPTLSGQRISKTGWSTVFVAAESGIQYLFY